MARRAMRLEVKGHTARWAGGEFIPVWRTDRVLQPVPDFLVQFPDSLKKSSATEEDIRRAVDEWMEANL